MLWKSHISVSVILLKIHFCSFFWVKPFPGLDFSFRILIKREFKCLVCWDGLLNWKRLLQWCDVVVIFFFLWGKKDWGKKKKKRQMWQWIVTVCGLGVPKGKLGNSIFNVIIVLSSAFFIPEVSLSVNIDAFGSWSISTYLSLPYLLQGMNSQQ